MFLVLSKTTQPQDPRAPKKEVLGFNFSSRLEKLAFWEFWNRRNLPDIFLSKPDHPCQLTMARTTKNASGLGAYYDIQAKTWMIRFDSLDSAACFAKMLGLKNFPEEVIQEQSTIGLKSSFIKSKRQVELHPAIEDQIEKLRLHEGFLYTHLSPLNKGFFIALSILSFGLLPLVYFIYRAIVDQSLIEGQYFSHETEGSFQFDDELADDESSDDFNTLDSPKMQPEDELSGLDGLDDKPVDDLSLLDEDIEAPASELKDPQNTAEEPDEKKISRWEEAFHQIIKQKAYLLAQSFAEGTAHSGNKKEINRIILQVYPELLSQIQNTMDAEALFQDLNHQKISLNQEKDFISEAIWRVIDNIYPALYHAIKASYHASKKPQGGFFRMDAGQTTAEVHDLGALKL